MEVLTNLAQSVKYCKWGFPGIRGSTLGPRIWRPSNDCRKPSPLLPAIPRKSAPAERLKRGLLQCSFRAPSSSRAHTQWFHYLDEQVQFFSLSFAELPSSASFLQGRDGKTDPLRWAGSRIPRDEKPGRVTSGTVITGRKILGVAALFGRLF